MCCFLDNFFCLVCRLPCMYNQFKSTLIKAKVGVAVIKSTKQVMVMESYSTVNHEYFMSKLFHAITMTSGKICVCIHQAELASAGLPLIFSMFEA